jgi:hypothetical protein
LSAADAKSAEIKEALALLKRAEKKGKRKKDKDKDREKKDKDRENKDKYREKKKTKSKLSHLDVWTIHSGLHSCKNNVST